MMKYRVVKYVNDSGSGSYYYEVQVKKWFRWVNPFKTKYELGRFFSEEEAVKAAMKIMPFEIVTLPEPKWWER